MAKILTNDSSHITDAGNKRLPGKTAAFGFQALMRREIYLPKVVKKRLGFSLTVNGNELLPGLSCCVFLQYSCTEIFHVKAFTEEDTNRNWFASGPGELFRVLAERENHFFSLVLSSP